MEEFHTVFRDEAGPFAMAAVRIARRMATGVGGFKLVSVVDDMGRNPGGLTFLFWG